MNLQDIVDELARSLRRSVVVNDTDYRPLAVSAQGDEIDSLRMESLLRRETPVEARRYLETLRLDTLQQPITIDLDAFGGRQRLAVPIRDGERLLGVLWLIVGGLPALSGTDLASVNAAVELARRALLPEPGTHSRERSDGSLMRLLDADPVVRRQAFAEAVGRRLIARGPQTVVRAVLHDGEAAPLERAAFGRRVTASHAPVIRYLGESEHCLLFIGRAADGEAIDAALRSESVRRLLPVRAIGSAAHAHDDDDLTVAVARAVAAARLAAGLPELGGRADVADVGGWMLLDAVEGDRSSLAVFSPAAAELLEHGDEVQRHTIETYLDAGGHAQLACDRLHIHRTTLYYRLDNMPASVRRALDDGLLRSALHLTLKLARLWEGTGRL
ncbi:helix-turn-helix domain-containing protein [Leifsonia sp. ZF2019]|uniref:helix-turn-helix domain-containing protein n=1 Tax=Leifsonia sp. ZF2019 TaxID=2781978 RepID=UPI001CBE2BEE|nr:helix-turn-helix domain-containing protein [Leifsonia sp. ZF2019]UAJ79314.1 helix-turn-helix domain-containing protein [Leifsonia sp. ZF2019]